MAKKYKNTKLAQGSIQNKQIKTSPFGKFANRLAEAKKKKAEKMTDTQKRLIQSKRNNKMIKVSKKTKKFGLLDDDQNLHEGGLTHKGMPLKQMEEFNDMQFDSEMLENNQQFQNAHDNLNFAGFEQQQQKNQQNQDKRPKSKNQVYKQIIQKSKAYKMFRQQIYQQNLNVATQLDEQFQDFVGNLKFRSHDKKIKDKIQGRDLDYDRLMNELKEDQRIVSNKVVQKNEKYTEKIRKKKSDQLNKIMKDVSDDQNDIRGWIQDVNNDSEQEQQQQEQQDELDDVQLSSGDQQQQEEDQQQQQQEFQGQDEENQLEPDQEQSQNHEVNNEFEDQSQQDQDHQYDDNQDNQDQQQEQEQPVYIQKNKNKKNKMPQKRKSIKKQEYTAHAHTKHSENKSSHFKKQKINQNNPKPVKRRLNKVQ